VAHLAQGERKRLGDDLAEHGGRSLSHLRAGDEDLHVRPFVRGEPHPASDAFLSASGEPATVEEEREPHPAPHTPSPFVPAGFRSGLQCLVIGERHCLFKNQGRSCLLLENLTKGKRVFCPEDVLPSNFKRRNA